MEQLIAEDPERIGPYRLIARLGAGGMGLVYLGRSEAGRTVAVKVVQAEHAAHPEFRRRFAREVAAARRVGGAWTADVLDADTDAQVPWVATQYIPGPDLTSVVAKDFGPLPEPSVRVLAHRLAEALTAVHGAGLIHRDLKPSNVLVTVDGPRVIDFGIARAMDGLATDSLLTHTGMLIGSPGFMSPEQVRGSTLTAASDVFCLGAVLVYASTGRLLFGAGTSGLNAHMFKVAEEEADLTGVPDTLLDLVQACLRKDPGRRPTPAQIMERTAPQAAGEWLPGSVLAQLGRHAAQLLDFAPVTRAPAGPQAAAPHPAAPTPVAPDPAVPTPAVPAQPGNPYAGSPHVPGGYVPTTPADPTGPPAGRRRTLIVAALAQLMVVLDAAVSIVGFGRMTEDVGLAWQAGWLLTGHALVFGGLLLVGGHLCDVVGRRTTLLIGLTGCVVASVLTASAPDTDVLAWGRVLQGASAALVTPAALALTAAGAGSGPSRGKVLGTYALVGIGGPLFAIPFAAMLAQAGTWRIAYYALAVLTLLVVVAAAAVVQDRTRRNPARFDLVGTVLGTLGLLAVGFGTERAFTLPGIAPGAVGAIAAGGLLLAAFFWWQSRAAEPMLPSSVWRDSGRKGVLLALVLAVVALQVLAYGQVAFSFMFGSGPGCVTAVLAVVGYLFGARKLAPRLSDRARLVGGLLLTGGGLVPMPFVEVHGFYAFVLVGLLVCALGLGLASGSLFAAATEGVPSGDTGAMAGAVHALLQVGAWVGTVVAMSAFEGAHPGLGLIVDHVSAPRWWGAAALLVVAAAVAGRSRQEAIIHV
ncbi:MFS transporter [Streptomyces triticagri]|uniref:MFS transporter n=1 Tax=Streptomyces triticagri TaxID=2293568 RepID=A0A372M5H0_9ACTN|nr:bifunctional serine/threonine protein kinase/MFS transporter [Streptomyces triticagri]RFU85765.1 MFS transporter [Streptomyces triticagri]